MPVHNKRGGGRAHYASLGLVVDFDAICLLKAVAFSLGVNDDEREKLKRVTVNH